MQVIFIITLFVLLSFFITAPDVVFRASQNAVLLWANTIVPSMLPFFILNTLLHSAGGIELIGKCFRRPAEKILNLPGEAAFILATGYSTGVPVSASLVAELRKNNMLSREEGNRLLAFGANVSPAFLLSAVSISMLGAKELGPYLAAVHYGVECGEAVLYVQCLILGCGEIGGKGALCKTCIVCRLCQGIRAELFEQILGFFLDCIQPVGSVS